MENVRSIAEGQVPLAFNWCKNKGTNDFLNSSIFFIGSGVAIGYLLSVLTAYKGCVAFGTTMGCGMTLNYWDDQNQSPKRRILLNSVDGQIQAYENELLTNNYRETLGSGMDATHNFFKERLKDDSFKYLGVSTGIGIVMTVLMGLPESTFYWAVWTGVGLVIDNELRKSEKALRSKNINRFPFTGFNGRK